jgi:hypothetical protein
MIQILKLVFSPNPNAIKMALLRTCLQPNHDMSFLKPIRQPGIEMSHRAEVMPNQTRKKIKQQY